MQLSQLTTIIGGALVGNDAEISSVSIDSRTMQPGCLFVALRGSNFDGHEFVQAAAQRGAAAAIVESEVECDLPQIVVTDALRALSDYARWHRLQFDPAVIAVTGSCGKTTTRALLESVFSQAGLVLATEGNYNNEIGVPLMLLKLTAQHRYLIIEMGASHKGEIAHLADLVRPHIGIITNAAAAHIEGFGTVADVAAAKGELFEALDASGTAVINADDDYYGYWLSSFQSKAISFGLSDTADVRAKWKLGQKPGFTLCLPGEVDQTINLKLLGKHNVRNALAAAAAAQSLGLSAHVIKKGLELTEPVPGRLVEKKGLHGAQVIDDTYNANPFSVKAAIDMLSQRSGNKILVLADMRELGTQTEDWHYDVGLHAMQQGIQYLYAYGASTRHSVRAFGERALHFSDQAGLVAALKKELSSETVVLVKGSNSMNMSQVVDSLVL